MDAVPLFPSSEKPGPPSPTFYGPSTEADTEPSRFTVVDVTAHNVVVLIQEAQRGGSTLQRSSMPIRAPSPLLGSYVVGPRVRTVALTWVSWRS